MKIVYSRTRKNTNSLTAAGSQTCHYVFGIFLFLDAVRLSNLERQIKRDPRAPQRLRNKPLAELISSRILEVRQRLSIRPVSAQTASTVQTIYVTEQMYRVSFLKVEDPTDT